MGTNKEEIIRILKANKDLKRKYSITGLYLFGSVARGESKDASDVDILVKFEPETRIGMFQFIRLRRELRDLLECEVDLTTPEALHHELKDQILKEAVNAG